MAKSLAVPAPEEMNMPIEALWGVGTLILLAGLIFGLVRYRRSRAAREQDEIERRSARWTPQK